MDRFNGKHLVNRPVSDGIRKTEQLINEALAVMLLSFTVADKQLQKNLLLMVRLVNESIKI